MNGAPGHLWLAYFFFDVEKFDFAGEVLLGGFALLAERVEVFVEGGEFVFLLV